MDKKQVQEAISRIDNALAQLNINRQGHIILTNDLQLVQKCCTQYFDATEAQKDGRTIKLANYIKPCDEDCEGSGDSV